MSMRSLARLAQTKKIYNNERYNKCGQQQGDHCCMRQCFAVIPASKRACSKEHARNYIANDQHANDHAFKRMDPMRKGADAT